MQYALKNKENLTVLGIFVSEVMNISKGIDFKWLENGLMGAKNLKCFEL